MAGEIALDTSVAIRFLNGDPAIVAKVIALPRATLPIAVIGELLFGAENSTRSLENLSRYLAFINTCPTQPMSRETAKGYARVRVALRRKGRPIPENDIWIAAQCIEQDWTLATADSDFSYIDELDVEQW